MKTIKVQNLTPEAFQKYGSYMDMLHPKGEVIGESPVEFYRDLIQTKSVLYNSASFSVCHITKRDMNVSVSEFHNYCSEGSMPIDGDVIVHLAPACPGEDPPEDKIEAFLIPKGTFYTVNPGVWHHAPFAYDTQEVNVLVMLPERTYQNDCVVVEHRTKIKIEK